MKFSKIQTALYTYNNMACFTLSSPRHVKGSFLQIDGAEERTPHQITQEMFLVTLSMDTADGFLD